MSICAVCEHPQRVEIERDLSEYRTSGRTLLSQRYGVSQADLALHWEHLREALAETRESVLERVQRVERLAEASLLRAVARVDEEGNPAVREKDVHGALREMRGAHALLVAMLPRQQQPGDGRIDIELVLRAEIQSNPAFARGLLGDIARALGTGRAKQILDAACLPESSSCDRIEVDAIDAKQDLPE